MAVSLPAVGIRFRAEGDAAVISSIRRVEQAAAQSGRVVGSIGLSAEAARSKSVAAAQGISMALETMARTGNTAGEGMKQLVAQAGHLAFAFGIGGPLTAAVGVAGLAIVQMISNTRSGLRELIDDIQKARLTSGQLAEESARGTLATVRARLAKLRAEEEALKQATGGATTQGLRSRITELESAEAAQMQTLERASRSSAMARLELLKRLREAGRANAQELGEIAAIEARLRRDMELGNLTMEERVQLLPPKQKEVKAAVEDTSKAFDAQLAALLSLAEQGRLTTATYEQLKGAEMGLALVIAQGTGSIQDQVKAWEQLNRVRNATSLGSPQIGRGTGAAIPDGTGGPASQLPMPNLQGATVVLDEEFLRLQDRIHQSLSAALANGLAAGFADGLSVGAIVDGFKQMTASILQQLGSAAIEIGLKTQAIAKLIAAAKTWMAANPWAAIAIGASLVALGAAMGGRGGGAGGRSVGGTSSTSATDRVATRLFVNGGASRAVTPQQAVVVNLQTVNPADPATQRLLTQTIRNAERRGY